jgi:GNAT superfamily N-acetyltransferase
MPLEVRPVRGPVGRRRFVDFPFRLFANDPEWVPPLRLTVSDRISPRYPAQDHQQTQLWMAYRRGRPVGRVGACIDRLYNELHDESWGWVGFFESFDDQTVARALLDTACSWAADHGAATCVGPASFTTNDECGLLVEGFEHPPLFQTPHNPPYYERLWTGSGWTPAMDLWGWWYRHETAGLSERQRAVMDRIKKRADAHVHSLDMANYDAEVARLFDLYNQTWAGNWGFVPMSKGEIDHLAKALKRIIDPDLMLALERSDGEALAVALSLPDVNEVLRGVRSGRLLPFGWVRLLRGLPKATRARVFILGVRPEQQNRALGVLLYEELIDRLKGKGMLGAEASWILATNKPMNSAIEGVGGVHYKTWRLYRREL